MAADYIFAIKASDSLVPSASEPVVIRALLGVKGKVGDALGKKRGEMPQTTSRVNCML